MQLVFYLTLLMVASFSRGNEDGMLRREEGERDNDNSNSDEAFSTLESFGSPVYGPNSFKSGGKSGYNVPTPALPASYAAYLTNLVNSYAYGPYNRVNMQPYTYPSAYGYGGSLLNNPAYSSALMSGLGYAGYGSPYAGRSAAYPGLGYGYPGYMGNLGYRYLPDSLRRGPAPVVGIAPPVSRAAPTAPLATVPPPVPAITNSISGVPGSDPVFLPYRPPLRAIRGKDGVVRYGYGPDGQNLPVY